MKQLALFFLVLVFLYLLISFLSLSFDFRLWTESQRFAYTWFAGMSFFRFLTWYVGEQETI